MFRKSLGILFATTVIATAPTFALAADDFTAAERDSWTGAYIGVAVGAGGGVADLALGGGLVSLEGIGGNPVAVGVGLGPSVGVGIVDRASQ